MSDERYVIMTFDRLPVSAVVEPKFYSSKSSKEVDVKGTQVSKVKVLVQQHALIFQYEEVFHL